MSGPGSESVDKPQEKLKSSENSNSYKSSLNNEYSEMELTRRGDRMTLRSDEKREMGATRHKRTEFSFKAPSVELWKGLYQRHWPELLNYYNISLLGR